MKALSIRAAREALPRLDKLVNEHGEVVITRRGRPILRVIPLGRATPPVGSDRNAALRARLPVGPTSSTELIREDREDRF
jgi:antitoxin (DNA-binding transcriptional repressor) of toxin-antitoxin stability system